ncbi:hypothetical protein HKW97_25820 (plasmid) [Pseudomonas luteola]|uniref:hypothetical protein n=1 Tax=Pseudomonas luteola TaxID=47886 RepID=UPI00388F1A4C
MVTVLEIVDSAIKIGLGALISGVTTYCVAGKNQKHELQKVMREDRKSLIKDMSKKYEEALALVSRGVHKMDFEGVNNSESRDLIIESFIGLSEAKALANMCGSKEIYEEIDSYQDSLNDLYSYMRSYSDKALDQNKISNMIDALNYSEKIIHGFIFRDYEKALALESI